MQTHTTICIIIWKLSKSHQMIHFYLGKGHGRHIIIYSWRQTYFETHMINTHINDWKGPLRHQNYILRSARSQKLLKFLSLWKILIPVYSITNQRLSFTRERRVFFCALYNSMFERLWEEKWFSSFRKMFVVLSLLNNHKQACYTSSINLQNMYLSSRTTISFIPSTLRILILARMHSHAAAFTN